MAGGTFTAQNKIRPGAYVNFKAVQPMANLGGVRGIVTIPLALPWGAEGQIISVSSRDFASGNSNGLIGLNVASADESAQKLRMALRNCPTALVYRLDSGGTKAKMVVDGLEITALYTGERGNNINVVVTKTDELYTVETYISNILSDTQTVADVDQLIKNELVEFAAVSELAMPASASVVLEGGSNGTVSASDYIEYFAKVKGRTWNVMALPTSKKAIIQGAVMLVRDLRENQGRKCQVVVSNYSDADYEGVISVSQGFTTEFEEVSPLAFTAYMAGLTAGSAVNVSNTHRVILGAVEITNEKTHDEIINSLKNGELVLSRRQDGAVIIEQDINTLTTFGGATNSAFRKNRVLRVLDDIANTISERFMVSYLGRVDNNDSGRTVLKGDIVGYFNQLQAMGAITDFISDDVNVELGDSVDSVEVNVAVRPVDAMEKLYMTVSVN